MSRSSAVMLLMFSLVTVLACGWFDDVEEETFDVTYEENFDTDVPIDAGALCPAETDCSSAAVPSPVERELKPIEFNFDVDIVMQTMKPELADYAGKFKSIEITKITYEPQNNDLTMDIPPLTLYVGPVGSDKVDANGVFELATLPEIPAGSSMTGNATINTKNTADISALIQSLQVALLAKATPKVKMGQQFPPSGKTDLKITVFIKLVANPADIARKSQ